MKGKCAAAVLPSSNEYYDFEKKEFVKLDTPRVIGNTTGGSWHGVVSNFSANPEAAYSFLSLMAIPPVSKLMATVGWDGVDPGFSYQFLEEDGGTAKIEDYVKAGWAENDAKTPWRPPARWSIVPWLRSSPSTRPTGRRSSSPVSCRSGWRWRSFRRPRLICWNESIHLPAAGRRRLRRQPPLRSAHEKRALG